LRIKISKGYTIPAPYKFTTIRKEVSIEQEFIDNINFEKCVGEVEELVDRALRFVRSPDFTYEERENLEPKEVKVWESYGSICNLCGKNSKFSISFLEKKLNLCEECFEKFKSFLNFFDIGIKE
jgi:hypothetical protein